MESYKNINFLFEKVSVLKGVGNKISVFLKKKGVKNINDLILDFPYSYTDRSKIYSLDKLEIGKVATVRVKVDKYNFPRKRNLPNKVLCSNDTGKINIIFFNSREGYIRKVLPINDWVIISGKINYYKANYQIANPDYILPSHQNESLQKIIPKYSLTEGINEKKYRSLIEQTLLKIPNLDEWHPDEIIKEFKFESWRDSILKVHNIKEDIDINSKFYRRLAFDEIISHILALYENRKKVKKIKKKIKIFKGILSKKIINNLPFKLTSGQNDVISEINIDLQSNNRMFRILQGDVGSGKTIVSLISACNVIESGYQCALMAPTEILAKQHFNLAKEIFKATNYNVEFLSSKIDKKKRINVLKDLKTKKIDFIIGTHSLFQKNVIFEKLGLIIIDEQHKFGVKQRMELSEKGGRECDLLLMSATPIPRTMMLAMYGDMDISKITEKPLNRKKVLTLSKPENKINDIWPFLKKEIKNNNQIFWICPLIDESKNLNYSSAKTKFKFINKKFPNRVGLIHGSLDENEKELILEKFQNKEIDILVSTTVIEVGIDFPNANIIIIENANKYGLAQLHQLRGRVGRGIKQGNCILLFSQTISEKAIKRIKILKSSNDGFYIADQDMKLRGYGDILGFKQSGIKHFRLADPVLHEDLFNVAENYIQKIQHHFNTTKTYQNLLKIFDKAEIIND